MAFTKPKSLLLCPFLATGNVHESSHGVYRSHIFCYCTCFSLFDIEFARAVRATSITWSGLRYLVCTSKIQFQDQVFKNCRVSWFMALAMVRSFHLEEGSDEDVPQLLDELLVPPVVLKVVVEMQHCFHEYRA